MEKGFCTWWKSLSDEENGKRKKLLNHKDLKFNMCTSDLEFGI